MGAGGEGDGGAAPGNDDYIVIGAGPVGLLAVLGLIQEQGARKVGLIGLSFCCSVWGLAGAVCARPNEAHSAQAN